MHFLIKDLKGDVEVLVLCNYETKSVHKDSKFILPIDIQLIIKEPYILLFGFEEDETDFGIRVDCPTDVVFQSYSDWDTAGNKSGDGNNFVSKSYHVALR